MGYNQCNLKQFEALLSDQFEFYHDEAGMLHSKQAFINSVKNNICSLPYKPERRLIEHSLKVYPLKKNGVLYGAVQTGAHEFYAVRKDTPAYLTSTALFTHVWLLENNTWKLGKSISYDHYEPALSDTINESLLFTNRAETDKWLRKNHIPALGIGYIDKGKMQQITVYGTNEQGAPYADNTIFNVASLTKPITTMVVLQLVNSGKWDLDEPLYKYWTDPDVADDARSKQLTTRHILNQRSGFLNWRYLDKDGQLKFEAEPGTKYQYSGEGFEYLRKALESKFSKTLQQLADELIFMPLNMKDTRYYWDSSIDEARFAKWHKKDGSTYKIYKNTSSNAADDLLTTVEDYSRFLVWVMNGADLKTDLYAQMTAQQVPTKKAGQFIGLGWFIDAPGGNEKAITHGGDDIGVHTIVFMLPQSQRGLLIFTNSDNGTDAFIPVISHYLGAAGQAIIDLETK